MYSGYGPILPYLTIIYWSHISGGEKKKKSEHNNRLNRVRQLRTEALSSDSVALCIFFFFFFLLIHCRSGLQSWHFQWLFWCLSLWTKWTVVKIPELDLGPVLSPSCLISVLLLFLQSKKARGYREFKPDKHVLYAGESSQSDQRLREV